MPAPSSGLLRAALELKINQVKRATRSYLRDRTRQATGTFTSYALAAGLFAAAGVFVIAAGLVGAAALFRWVEINYGMFWAFGAVGALLLAVAAILAAVAAGQIKRPPPQFPSLASRLRVALKASPVRSGQVETARETAAAVLREPSSPLRSGAGRPQPDSRSPWSNRNVHAGLILAATLLGWAAVRRRQGRRTEP